LVCGQLLLALLLACGLLLFQLLYPTGYLTFFLLVKPRIRAFAFSLMLQV
jgi:hypothetical protein